MAVHEGKSKGLQVERPMRVGALGDRRWHGLEIVHCGLALMICQHRYLKSWIKLTGYYVFSNLFAQCIICGSGVNLYQPLQLMSSIRNMATEDSTIFCTCPGSRSVVITEMRHDGATFDRGLTCKSNREDV